MGNVLDLEYYNRDVLCTRILVDYTTGKVSVTNYTDDIMEQALGKRKSSIDSVLEFLGERVFEESRLDKGEILESMGLSVFDPEDIARVTHGIMFHDSNWLRFDGEDLSWEDIKAIKASI